MYVHLQSKIYLGIITRTPIKREGKGQGQVEGRRKGGERGEKVEGKEKWGGARENRTRVTFGDRFAPMAYMHALSAIKNKNYVKQSREIFLPILLQ